MKSLKAYEKITTLMENTFYGENHFFLKNCDMIIIMYSVYIVIYWCIVTNI